MQSDRGTQHGTIANLGGKSVPLTEARRYGWVHGLPDHRDQRLDTNAAAEFRGPAAIKSHARQPTKVDLRTQNWLPPIKDQGNLGSCTANAWAAAVEYEYTRMGRPLGGPSSRLFIYYNERALENSVDWDSGAMIRDGIKSLAKWGVSLEQDWPYSVDQFRTQPFDRIYQLALQHEALTYGYVDNQGVEYHIKDAIAAFTPVVFGFTVYPSFESAGPDGVIPIPKLNESPLGGHACLIVGYETLKSRGKVYAICQNSWGTSWGDQGFFYLPLVWLTSLKNADDFWAIQSMK